MHIHAGGKTVLSRFHWHVATIWTEPLEENDKPAVKFTTAIHTPIIKSTSYDYRYVEIEATTSVKERIEIVNLYIPILDMLLRNVRFSKKGRGYKNILQSGGVPAKYLFELSEIKTAVVIGKLPKPEELPETLKNKLWQN